MKRVLVIGDIIADVYRQCTYKKMCPDDPTVRAFIEHTADVRPGGAANVAVNLAALTKNVKVDLIGVLDGTMMSIIKGLSAGRVRTDFCELVGHNGGDIRKERICTDVGETVCRVDSRRVVNGFMREMVLSNLKDYLAEHDPDLIVLSDYGAETVSEDCLDLLLTMCDRLLVDTKRTDLSKFDGTALIKFNELEWLSVLALGDDVPERHFKCMVVTRGNSDTLVTMRMTHPTLTSITHTLRVPVHPVAVVDVCGCGDTAMAGIAASLLNSSDPFTAVQFANAAAATVITQKRTAVADLSQTLKLLGRTEV